MDAIGKVLDYFGFATPFMYAAAAYGFFAWLDENLPHRTRGEREEMHAVDRSRFRRRVKFYVDLMHQRGRVERSRTSDRSALTARDAAQFLIHPRKQRGRHLGGGFGR